MKTYRNMMLVLLLSGCSYSATKAPLVNEYGEQLFSANQRIAANFDMRYVTDNNFVGEKIDGYRDNSCYLTEPTLTGIIKAADKAIEQGYKLHIFDCYRPQIAVDHFYRWSQSKENNLTKAAYYPKLDKKDLFDLGYIAKRSGHTKGTTVDLTLVDVKTGKELNMGAPFDYFDEISHTENKLITSDQQHNRLILRSIMTDAGFKNYSKEWWHYSLAN